MNTEDKAALAEAERRAAEAAKERDALVAEVARLRGHEADKASALRLARTVDAEQIQYGLSGDVLPVR